jgi:hypothetical protein
MMQMVGYKINDLDIALLSEIVSHFLKAFPSFSCILLISVLLHHIPQTPQGSNAIPCKSILKPTQ